MRTRKSRIFMGDFETTVYENQEYTEVWASACVELYTEDVHIFHSIAEQFEYFVSLKENIICYYHNLKFDGAFWLSYLLTELKYSQAYDKVNEQIIWKKQNEMSNKSVKYTISDMGQWYSIIIKTNNKYIEIRDSLKLLPFSVKKIGKSFNTKHKKLDIEYTGYRYAGCEITDDEKQYIANDVLVVKEALEIMFNEGHSKLTIGACCLDEFKKTFYDKNEYDSRFPNLYNYEINEEQYGAKNAGEYIRKSYRGGWCYLVQGKENKIKHNGTTADVNSLYPSMMSSESGNRYPMGLPTFWKGNYIPDDCYNSTYYYFIRIKTRFYLKDGYLPFIQLKHNPLYVSTESLKTSDIYDATTGEYYTHYYDSNHVLKPATVIMTLTQTDFALIKEHYELVDFEILDGCYFLTDIGMFDTYMNKYKKIKQTSKGALRELAKLFLNNLYGKLASNTNSSFKVASEKTDGSLSFIPICEHNKKAGYIPCGSAITSYARNFTIRAAQMNYHGVDKRGFIYADTDSIHCDLSPEEIVGIKVHPTDFCCWKLESCWDIGLFTRQKTYIEHITHEDLQPIDTPYYNVKCAGMPEKCKQLFIASITQDWNKDDNDYTKEELEFVSKERKLEDFKVGLVVPGKLLPKRIKGGIVLQETSYEMR